MTKKVPKEILRIERHFFVNLRKKLFFAAHAAPRRRRRFFGTDGAPPPPTEIDRRAADTMTSAHSSRPKTSKTLLSTARVQGALCNIYQLIKFNWSIEVKFRRLIDSYF